MTKKLLILLLLLVAAKFYPQTSCGTPQSTVQNFSGPDTQFSGGAFTCINVQFHVVRYSNGTGGVSESYVNQITDLLNSHFNPHGIYINKTGIDYINNSTGLFFNEPTTASLKAALGSLPGKTFNHDRIKAAANRFSAKSFQAEIKRYIDSVAKKS